MINRLDVFKRCYIVPKPLEQCLKDNQMREYPVPYEVIVRQRTKFQVPFMEEGWDQITIGEVQHWNEIYTRKMINFDQKNPHHSMNLWTHSNKTLNLFRKTKECQDNYELGALLHDYGKLFCQTFDKDGIAHYYDHQNISAYEIISAIPVPQSLDNVFLANYHMMPFNWKNFKTHEKWKRIFGEEKYNLLMSFHKCDIAAK